MAKFEKGNKESKGRPKGATNKTTADNRERVNNVLSWLHEEHLYADLKETSGSERIKTYIALMEYSLPKLQRIAHEGGTNAPIQVELVFDSTGVKPITSESDIKD
jgi:hypothetical protein